MKQTALVRSQPHRRGFPDPSDPRLSETDIFGRFCARNTIATELQTVGEKYRDLVSAWRRIMGLPCPFGYTADGNGFGLYQDQDPRIAEQQINAYERAMKARSKAGALAMLAMCRENMPAPDSLAPRVIESLDGLLAWITGAEQMHRQKKLGAGVLAWRGASNVFVVEDRTDHE